MPSPEVFLNAGDFFFTRAERARDSSPTLRTLLGSCVSIVLWHAGQRLGGMCHCVLPVPSPQSDAFDGNHCEGAMRLFRRELMRNGTRPEQYRVHLLGGARMSLGLRERHRQSVGERNVATCRALLREAGFALRGEHVGEAGPRRVEFNLADGELVVLHGNRRLVLA